MIVAIGDASGFVGRVLIAWPTDVSVRWQRSALAGFPGFLYWKLLAPVHRVAFARMARRRVRVGRAAGAQPG